MGAKNWINPTERLPEPGKPVLVLRRWAFGAELRTELRMSRRLCERPLVTDGEIWHNCYWADLSELTGTYNDQTVAGWQEIPPLADVVRACNAHDQLVAGLREIIKNDPFNQSSAGVIARAALAAAGAA